MKHLLRNLTKSVLFILMITFLLILCWCSKNPTEPLDDVNDYLLDLPSWESFSPIKPDTTEEGQPVAKIDYQNKMISIITPCSITRTPEKIVTYNPSSEVLYMGSLIQGRSYLGGVGTMEELPIRQRAPLTISIDLLSDDNCRIIEHPNLGSVQQAVGELVAAADSAGLIAGSSIYFNQTTSHSVEQSALKLGLSAKFMVASVKASLNWNQSQTTNTVAAYFIQKMFTTSMVIPQRPSDIFSSDFTKELLNEQIDLGRIGPRNLPVYVSNIVWGRMIMLTMTSTHSVDTMKAALRASYLNINTNIEQEHLSILKDSEIQLVTIGGDQSAALRWLREGKLSSFFETDAPLTSAVPISYTLRNLGDNSIARISETTKYDMVEYKPFKVELFSDEEEWKNSVRSLGFEIFVWETDSEHVSQAKELIGKTIPSKNAELGAILTFENVGPDSFGFQLVNTADIKGKEHLGLIYWDCEGKSEFPEGTISIGDINKLQDDDFDVRLMGSAAYAIAFEIGDNEFVKGEELIVDTIEENPWSEKFSYPALKPFIGIISAVPIGKIHFNEDDKEDDIYVKDFKFGIKK